VPQDGTNNGGIWNTFERYSRNLAFGGLCDSVEIISGPIFQKNYPFSGSTHPEEQKSYDSELIVLKKDGIVVPQKLYKIIKCNSK
jgi:DNA/RNA endonuclease G (NUC1)